MTNLIGQTLLNQFRVDSFVASGGMGAVYRVWDTKRNVPLAMKVLHADYIDDPSAFKSFQREARALQRLRHPNVVPFYGLYQAEEFTFILQAFIDGPSLREILKKHPAGLPAPEAIVYLRALCAALGYAHSNGVVHCDIKPANVMTDQGGQIYLADFGISRHAESTTTTLAGAGTPAYMAPEQIRIEEVLPATDIYALGVLLFEMLTGKRPFRGDEPELVSTGSTSGERIRHAHLHLQPPDPRQINPSISPALAAVVLKCLEKQPQNRYPATMGLLNDAIQALGDVKIPDLPIQVSHSQIGTASANLSSPDSQSSKRPLLFVGLAGLFMVICLGLFFIGGARLLSTTDGSTAPKLETPIQSNISAPTSTSESLVMPPEFTATFLPAETSTIIPTATISPQPPVSPLQGQGVVRLTFDARQPYYMPSLSPDQTRMIAFSQIDGYWQIVEVDPQGAGMVRQITKVQADHYHPHFSEDGSSILLASKRDGDFDIYLIDFETGDVLQKLTDDNFSNMTPYWMPDFRSFVFMSNKTGKYNIYLGFLDGSPPQALTDEAGDERSCSVSPDGTKIAFYSNRSGGNEIFILDITTGAMKQLTFFGKRSAEPVFSPDGRWIAFESNHSGNYDIWAIRLEDNELRQMTSSPANEQIPVFSPDGKWLLYQSDEYGSYDIFRIPWP